MTAVPTALDALTHGIIGAGIQVHRILGPDGVKLDCAYRLDLVVNETVIVEVKAIESLTEVHVSQMLTYLRLTGLPLGLLMNFNASTLKKGLKRVINT